MYEKSLPEMEATLAECGGNQVKFKSHSDESKSHLMERTVEK